jgi:hypothetical protein
MDELIPKQPFFERHEFLGSLVQDDKSADDLQIVVQFSLLKEGEIAGQVLGTSETFDKLARISDVTGPKLILRSKKDPDSRFEFYSDDVHLGSAQRRTWTPAYGNNIAYVVSELHFDKFEVLHRIEPRDSISRSIVFFLSGPRYMWEIISFGERSYTGEAKVDTRNTKIELDDALPFSIEVKPWYFYDKSSPPDVFDLKAHVLALELSTSIKEEELTNDAFVQKAIAVIEDLILLVSFMSRGWITWYSYEFLTPTFIKRHVRRARETSSRDISWNDTLVEHGQGRQFLKSAYTNLQKLRSEGINLFMSIAYYLSGLESKYMEEQFTTLFLALERTKDLFAQHNQEYLEILSPTISEPLSNSIKDQIKRVVDSPDIRGRIYDKIRELNRPSLRFVLDSLLSKNEISYTDLYPPGEEFSLISTRDQLFHSSKKIDYDHLFREFYRLKSVLERLLLRLLGWENFARSPDIYTMKLLHEKKKSSGTGT